MLIRFTVKNFLSFDSEQEFSMNTGAATTHEKRIAKMPEQSILKFSALYGANASGKSNLVKAIDFSRSIIIKGINKLNTFEKHFKLKPKNADLPTKFEYDLKINDKYYGYGFSVSLKDKKILNEWLVELKKEQEIILFEREASSNYKYHSLNFDTLDDKEMFDLQVRLVNDIENSLLISEVARRKNNPDALKILMQIYDWFKNELVIIYPDSLGSDMTNIFKNSDAQLVNLLKYFDTGITDYELVASSFDQIKQYIPKVIFEDIKSNIESRRELYLEKERKTNDYIGKVALLLENHLFEVEFNTKDIKMNEILFKHNNTDVNFTFGEESDGTKRLIELLEVIYNDSNTRTVIIDELDRNFHPQMTIKFVNTFLKYSEKLMTQLIITTHESSLMDLEFLRRDEIWFVEKDFESNESKLYSLEKFKVHNTKKVAKDYLIGRYGAVPVFKDFDSYLENLNDNS